MPQKNAQDRLWKILTPVLLVLAVLAMAKTLFVGLEIDEEYAFSLGFRLVKGDRLFYTMWEPHQLSALPAALVLALYTAIAGTTTGALLFVRAVVLVCKAAMSAVFYRDFKQTIGRHGALLSAVVLFVYTPKWFLGPDYISQQFHFTVAAFLCFYHYYTHGFRRPWLVVLGAMCACFSFLAFPQSALAAAVIFIGMVLLGRRGKEPTICKIPRGAVLFVLGCMACAAAFLAYVLPGMGLTAFLQRVSLILNDPQYDFTTSQRLALLASQALNTAKFLAKPLAASVVLCLLWWAKTRQKRDWIGLALNLWAILAALLCVVRAVADSSSDERYFMPALVLAAAWAFRKGGARHSAGAAVLAGLSAGHSGVCVHSALYAAGLFGYLYVSDLARALRLLCHVGVQAGESGAGKTAPGPVCAGGAAGIFAGMPVLVRSGNGLEACQCGNSQPEADHRRPRRRDLGGRKSRRYADGPVRSAGTLCGQAGAAGYWRAARPWLYDGGRNLDHRSGVRHLRYRQRPAVHPVL